MFRSILGSVTPHLSMLSQLNNFVDSMLPSSFDNSFQFPPKTYLAYAAGLRLFVNSFHDYLLQLETEVRKQGRNRINIFCLLCWHYFLQRKLWRSILFWATWIFGLKSFETSVQSTKRLFSLIMTNSSIGFAPPSMFKNKIYMHGLG